MKKFNAVNALTYTTRAWAFIISLIAILFMISSQFGFADGQESIRETITFLFFPIGTCTGLMIGWKNEKWGGIISTLSLIGYFSIAPQLLNDFAFIFFLATPALLYLLIWFLKQRARREEE